MTDLRCERTRGYLREALEAILLEKPFDRVTVREVVERARVSKGSFYNHYADLEALVQDCYLSRNVYFCPPTKHLRDYACRRDAATETLDVRANTLAFFRDNPNLGRVFLDNVCVSPYFSEVRRAEEGLLIDHIDTEYGEDVLPYLDKLRCARFIVWGMFGLSRAWFQGGMRESIEEATRENIYYALQVTASMAGRPIEPEYRAAIEAWHFCEGRLPTS